MLAGSVQSPGRAALLRHVFIVEAAVKAQSTALPSVSHHTTSGGAAWGAKLELDPRHPVSKLHPILDKTTASLGAIEPVNPAAWALAAQSLGGIHPGGITCLDFRAPAGGAAAAGDLVQARSADELASLLAHPAEPAIPGASSRAPLVGWDIMVCTHGARDERCGRLGPALLQRLSDAAASAGVAVRLWGASHVGGHRFAPTALVFPGGHWWGHLDPRAGGHEAASELLAALLDPELLRRRSAPGPLIGHWRGCMGMTKAEQLSAANRGDANGGREKQPGL